jgi:hypothetical protein
MFNLMSDFSHSLALQPTAASFQVTAVVGDSLLPGFVGAQFPAAVAELGR